MLGKLFGKFGPRKHTVSAEHQPVELKSPEDDLGFSNGELPEANILWEVIENAKPKYMLDLLQAITDRRITVANYGQFTAITRRLLDIRYHENVSKELREVFDTLSKQYLAILETNDDPDSAKNIKAAIDHTIRVGTQVGYGTVGYALVNHADDHAAYKFAVQPSQAGQLAAFFAVYEKTASRFVPRLLSTLLDTSLPKLDFGDVSLRHGAPPPLRNVPLGVSWLLWMGNPTIRLLLTPTEKAVFFHAVSRYEDARNFSLKFGLIEDDTQKDRFDYRENPEALTNLLQGFIGDSSDDVTTGLRDATKRATRHLTWDGLPEHIQLNIRHWLVILRAHLAVETLKNYADNHRVSEIIDRSMANLSKETRAIFDQDLEVLRLAADRVKTGPFDQLPDTDQIPGFDMYIATRLMDDVQALNKSEAETLELMAFIMTLIRDQWLLAANKVRFLLRFSTGDKPAREEDTLISSEEFRGSSPLGDSL